MMRTILLTVQQSSLCEIYVFLNSVTGIHFYKFVLQMFLSYSRIKKKLEFSETVPEVDGESNYNEDNSTNGPAVISV